MDTKTEPIEIKKVDASFYFFKRLFDIVFSFLAIILLSWLLLIVFIVEIFATKGRPIFVDTRIGKNGKEIKIFKFRTMFNDAEENVDLYLDDDQMKQWNDERKVDNDPRISKHGSFLRKTSIDELPQFFNILGGSMSLVGPRPMTKKEVQKGYNDEQRAILLSTKPGLTGTWQVYGREIKEFRSGERQKLDMLYFQKRSLWYDFKIIMKTIPVVFKQKGAK